jgi:outer membrane immunogenic protein
LYTAPFAGSTQRSGSTVGGGLEYSLAKNWSAKAEYQYINLGRENLFGTSTAGVTLTTSAIRDRFSTVRFGVNYHFK